uniref:hypothetical protein n=1 Tax=Flavobacterium sp. TaxID=239 RepID=UPI004049D1BE
MSEEASVSEAPPRDQIEDIIDNEEPVNEEPVNEELHKPKSKPKIRAKPKIKITKEPIEPVIEEAIVEVIEKPKKIDKLKEIVKCPDCHMDMTVHTLKYIQKRRGFCKAIKAKEPEKTPEPVQPKPVQPKPITEDTVNDY